MNRKSLLKRNSPATSFRGALVGDFVGSVIEGALVSPSAYPDTRIIGNRFDYPRGDRTGEVVGTMPLIAPGCCFTDDTLLSAATAEYLGGRGNYIEALRRWYWVNPEAGFGKAFAQWIESDAETVGTSWANGAAMRMGPVIDMCLTLDDSVGRPEAAARQYARQIAYPSHNHPEAITGACSIALAGTLIGLGCSKEFMREAVVAESGYDLSIPLDERRAHLTFSTRAIDTVPLAIMAFLEGDDFESTLRRALSLGHDTDTIAAMACAIAAQCYPIPECLMVQVESFLPDSLAACLATYETVLALSSEERREFEWS